jgi:hypothetical protein
MTCGLADVVRVVVETLTEIPFCANKRGAMIRLAVLKPKQLAASSC